VYLAVEQDEQARATVRLRGRWTALAAPALLAEIDALALPAGKQVLLDPSAAEAIDLSGAYFLKRLETRLATQGLDWSWRGAAPPVLELADQTPPADAGAPDGPAEAPDTGFETVGRFAVQRLRDLFAALAFFGRIVAVLGGAFAAPRRLRLTSVARHVEETGISAIPIVALIAFLISVIVAYISAQELRQFGGEVFVVDLVSISVLRELGVLLTAIIVAGRSGSAFAAEIGVMRLNEEVDALAAMGVDLSEVLITPRVLGLVIALPLLTVIADAMGIAGGAVLSWLLLDIPFNRFVARMHEALSPTAFWAGLLKAPVFAVVIAMVGCYRGLQVRESSRELGRLTTVAVVESIFAVILIDALFAVVYWKIDF
jgi:phospholipid/cholesterol/gamma-HCH transport system permease protein